MSNTTRLGTPDVILVRYGELALKGGNRKIFEDALARNIRNGLKEVTKVRVRKLRGRLLVFADSRMERVTQRIRDIFGISSISPGWMSETHPKAVTELASRVLSEALERRPGDSQVSFRVHDPTRRKALSVQLAGVRPSCRRSDLERTATLESSTQGR